MPAGHDNDVLPPAEGLRVPTTAPTERRDRTDIVPLTAPGPDADRRRARGLSMPSCCLDWPGRRAAGDTAQLAARGARRCAPGAARRRLASSRPAIEVLTLPGLGLPALRPGVAAPRHRQPAHRHADASAEAGGERCAAAAGHHHRRRPPAARAAASSLRGALFPPRVGGTDRSPRRWSPISRNNGYARSRDGARAGRIRGARRHRRPVPAGRRAAAARRFLRRRRSRRSAPSIP